MVNLVAAIDNAETRSALVSNIVNFTQANQLDGFDIDYEDYNHWNTNSLVAFAEALHEAKKCRYVNDLCCNLLERLYH